MSVRRLVALWRNLPADAAIHISRDPGGHYLGRWTTESHLLALLSEQIDGLHSTTYAAAAGKKAKKWPPLRHKRPQLLDSEQPAPKPRRKANAAETLAILRGEI